jgi:primosomal replication protein N
LAGTNRLELSARLVERDALRYTPAGVALLDFKVEHASEQVEAGAPRQVTLEMSCLAVERDARLIAQAPLGSAMELSGFVAPRAKSSRSIVLHVTDFEFSQGDQDGHVRQG